MRKAVVVTSILLATLSMTSCGGNPATPSSGAIVTFSVLDEQFKVWMTDGDQIAIAKAAQNAGHSRIPTGRIARGAQVNIGWSWHLEEVSFAEFTIELCDGRPSDVEREGVTFGGGRFCPWTARVLRIDEQ